MSGRRRRRWLGWTWAFVVLGCGIGADEWERSFPTRVASGDALQPRGGLEVAPVKEEARPRPEPPMFQPAFHQALRSSHSAGGTTTFRLRVPVGKQGQRLRLTFRSGDGNLTLRRATVARAGPDGALASEPVEVTFSGAPGFTVGPRTRVASDPVPFPVDFGEELAVSFEVQGALSSSAPHVYMMPGGRWGSGSYAGTPGTFGAPWPHAVGLATLEVEGPPSRAFVAVGDSITEGYILGPGYDDLRKSWVSLAQAQLGVPVVNAGVSGQGFYGALENLDQEVLALSGITDCVVLLGTNDLSALSVGELQARMNKLLSRLRPFCRPWVATLLPKEKSNSGDYEQVKSGRLAMNAWIRNTMPDVIDLEAVTRSPGNVHLFIDGLEVDGIHPSREGHRVIADEVVRVLREAGVEPQEGALETP